MGDVSPTGDQARDALRRYNEFVTRQLTRAFWSGDGNYAGGITQRDAWINARREYLANVLIEALRRNDPSKSG